MYEEIPVLIAFDANSLTPKLIFLPNLFLEVYWSPFWYLTFVEEDKSLLPININGLLFATIFKTSPQRFLVANSFSSLIPLKSSSSIWNIPSWAFFNFLKKDLSFLKYS